MQSVGWPMGFEITTTGITRPEFGYCVQKNQTFAISKNA
jgi:hypothetical protein